MCLENARRKISVATEWHLNAFINCLSCVVQDLCASESHGCQQICVNTPGSYVCQCYEAYELAKDKKSCKSKLSSVFIHLEVEAHLWCQGDRKWGEIFHVGTQIKVKTFLNRCSITVRIPWHIISKDLTRTAWPPWGESKLFCGSTSRHQLTSYELHTTMKTYSSHPGPFRRPYRFILHGGLCS